MAARSASVFTGPRSTTFPSFVMIFTFFAVKESELVTEVRKVLARHKA